MENYIDSIINNAINDGEISGVAVRAIKDNKEIFRKNYGYACKEDKRPIQNNTIYRMYSMSKPVTAAALMILVDRGIVDLNEPVSKYMDTYKNPMVITSSGTFPAKREVLIKDAFNMTCGMPYPDYGSAAGRLVDDLYNKLQQEQREGKSKNTVEWCRLLGELPLEFNPGENWKYGTGADVCGAVVEIASGMKFGDFLKKELFEPLNMVDTDFYVPEEKWDRFAEIYEYSEEEKCLVPSKFKHLGITEYRTMPLFQSGGAGLVSTIDDYSNFALMLLNNGKFNGKRILSRKAVEFLQSPNVSEEILSQRNWDSQRGYSYGNLMRIMRSPQEAGMLGSVGEYGWDGWTGNYFFIDPKENLVFFYFIQRTGGADLSILNKLKNVVYGSLE